MVQTQANCNGQTKVGKLVSYAKRAAVFAARALTDVLDSKEPTTEQILQRINSAPADERAKLLKKYGDRLSGAT